MGPVPFLGDSSGERSKGVHYGANSFALISKGVCQFALLLRGHGWGASWLCFAMLGTMRIMMANFGRECRLHSSKAMLAVLGSARALQHKLYRRGA